MARRQGPHRRRLTLVPDPLAATGQLAHALLVLGLLFVVPGVSWGPALAPGHASPIVAVGRAAGASLLVVGTACTVLAGLHLFAPLTIVATILVLSAVPFALPSMRATWSRRLHRRARGSRARRVTIGLVALAGAGVALALVLVPSRMAVGDAMLPFSSTVWYYTNLARETALQGGLPAQLAEWGTQRPFQADYLPATVHAAAAFALLPDMDTRVVLEVYRLAVLASAAAVAVLLLRRFVPAWLAVIGMCLLLATVRLEGKFLAYRPETWALVPAMFTLWLTDRAIVERSWRLALAAVFGAAVTWLAHAEVFLLLGPGVVGLIVARLLVGPGRLGLRLPARSSVLPVIGIGGAVLLGGMVVGSTASYALTGELRILGYVAGGGMAPADRPAPPPADEVPPGWTFTADPTWDFYVAAVAPGQLGNRPPSTFTDPRVMPRSIAWVWPGLDGRQRVFLLELLALLAVPVVAWPILDVRRRRLVLATALFGVGLAAGSYLLFAISDTYVPMRTGPRRLLPYELVLPVVAALVLLLLVDRLIRPGWRALLGRRSAVASWLAITVLAAGMVAPAPRLDDVDEIEAGLTTAGYDAYAWIDANLPADARLLANAYTDGAVAALARRTGIVDGRAVYLENPGFLADSTALLLGARTVFLDPTAVGSRRYLAREGVSHILVATGGATGADLGGYPLFDTDVAALERSRDYTLIRTFDDGRLRLYEVRRQGTTGG